MTPITALAFESQQSKRKVKVVCDDEDILQGDVFLQSPIPDGFSASVHKSGGFEENDFFAFVVKTSLCSQFEVGHLDLKLFGHKINDFETDVVTGFEVFISYISQTYNQVFSHVNGFCFAKKPLE